MTGGGPDGGPGAPAPFLAETATDDIGTTAGLGGRAAKRGASRPPPGDADAPLVTPTATARASLAEAFARARNRRHLSEPPLAAAPPSPSSRSSRSRSDAAARNPLDLLSAVSTYVADREGAGGGRSPRSEPPSDPGCYAGEVNTDGQRHGRGVMRYANGCRYDGCFRNDRRHGFGECRYPNGCVYAGFWSGGRRDGVGRMLYADREDVYEGEWAEDRRHGRGLYFRADGRADVVRYDYHDVVGEGTQWSPNREFVVRLVDGVNRGQISVDEALEIGARIGIPGVPKQMMFPAIQFNAEG